MAIEVFGNQDIDPRPLGTVADDLLRGTRITGRDPQTGKLGDGIQAQLKNAYANMRICVESAGGSIDNIAHVSMYWANFGTDRDEMNPPWVEFFPKDEDRPTYKFMPAPNLPEGERIAFEFFAVLGARRKLLAVDGVAHTNPIPLGVRIGRYLFSSRMLPYDPATGAPADGAEKQAEFLFTNTDALLHKGGLSWSNVVQGRAFFGDVAHRPLLDARWEAKFPDAARRPTLHRVRYGGGAIQVMLEVIATE